MAANQTVGKYRRAACKVTQTHRLNCQLALQLWSGASSRSLQQVTRSAFLYWYVHICTLHLCTCNASLRCSVCMLRTDLCCFMQTLLQVPPTLLDVVASILAWYAACRIIFQSTMPVRYLGTRQLVMGMRRRARGFGWRSAKQHYVSQSRRPHVNLPGTHGTHSPPGMMQCCRRRWSNVFRSLCNTCGQREQGGLTNEQMDLNGSMHRAGAWTSRLTQVYPT